MSKKKEAPEVQAHQIGDMVMWRGIPLKIIKILPDGRYEAHSLTMHVTGEVHEFDKVSHYGE